MMTGRLAARLLFTCLVVGTSATAAAAAAATPHERETPAPRRLAECTQEVYDTCGVSARGGYYNKTKLCSDDCKTASYGYKTCIPSSDSYGFNGCRAVKTVGCPQGVNVTCGVSSGGGQPDQTKLCSDDCKTASEAYTLCNLASYSSLSSCRGWGIGCTQELYDTCGFPRAVDQTKLCSDDCKTASDGYKLCNLASDSSSCSASPATSSGATADAGAAPAGAVPSLLAVATALAAATFA